MVQEKSFVDQVRRGRMASPTVRTFDASAWRTALDRAAGTGDEPIIRAGLWFGEALQARWRSIEALDLRRMSLGALTREMAAVANLMHLRTIAMAESAALELDRASLPSGSVAQVRLGAGDSAATADMIRTSTIDTLGKMVAYGSERRRRCRRDQARLRSVEPPANPVARRLRLARWTFLMMGRDRDDRRVHDRSHEDGRRFQTACASPDETACRAKWNGGRWLWDIRRATPDVERASSQRLSYSRCADWMTSMWSTVQS